MIVWTILFMILIIYTSIRFSITDRYLYLIQLLFSIALLPCSIYLVIKRIFVHNTLSLYNIIAIILCSIVLGTLFRLSTRIVADKKRRLLCIPGQYINLIPTFLLLCINYTISFLWASQKDFFLSVTPERQYLLIAFTTIMGIWTVMNMSVFYKYLRCKSTPIVIKKA
jgi:hypothetical protein